MLLRPMLATPADVLPEGPAWTYEVKWDGYRALAVKEASRVRLISRNQKDLTRDYPAVVSALAGLRVARVVLDGEIVALDAEGRPSFQALQHRATSDLALVYYAFDVLEVGAESLMRESLDARRERLALVTIGSDVLVSEPLPGAPRQIERQIRRLGLEGVVAKRRDSVYRPGERSDAWVKVKFSPRQEFVVGGFKPNGQGVESILVGYYGGDDLYFAGNVRAGLTSHLRAELFAHLNRRPLARCPFVNLPNSSTHSHWGEGISADDMKLLRWVRPVEVVEVSFVEWTRDNLLRHPRVLGLRNDKAPKTIRREKMRFGGSLDGSEK
jgi:bifunctional non-homologous end joining protein LigD